MPQENVEIIRRFFTDLPADFRNYPAEAGEYWEPDGDYYPVAAFPEARPCHGRGEVVAFLEDFLSAWETYDYEVLEVREAGDDRVFLHGRIKAEGRASGVALEGDIFHCFWMRHGRIIRQEDHLTEAGALEALG